MKERQKLSVADIALEAKDFAEAKWLPNAECVRQ